MVFNGTEPLARLCVLDRGNKRGVAATGCAAIAAAVVACKRKLDMVDQ